MLSRCMYSGTELLCCCVFCFSSRYTCVVEGSVPGTDLYASFEACKAESSQKDKKDDGALALLGCCSTKRNKLIESMWTLSHEQARKTSDNKLPVLNQLVSFSGCSDELLLSAVGLSHVLFRTDYMKRKLYSCPIPDPSSGQDKESITLYDWPECPTLVGYVNGVAAAFCFSPVSVAEWISQLDIFPIELCEMVADYANIIDCTQSLAYRYIGARNVLHPNGRGASILVMTHQIKAYSDMARGDTAQMNLAFENFHNVLESRTHRYSGDLKPIIELMDSSPVFANTVILSYNSSSLRSGLFFALKFEKKFALSNVESSDWNFKRTHVSRPLPKSCIDVENLKGWRAWVVSHGAGGYTPEFKRIDPYIQRGIFLKPLHPLTLTNLAQGLFCILTFLLSFVYYHVVLSWLCFVLSWFLIRLVWCADVMMFVYLMHTALETTKQKMEFYKRINEYDSHCSSSSSYSSSSSSSYLYFPTDPKDEYDTEEHTTGAFRGFILAVDRVVLFLRQYGARLWRKCVCDNDDEKEDCECYREAYSCIFHWSKLSVEFWNGGTERHCCHLRTDTPSFVLRASRNCSYRVRIRLLDDTVTVCPTIDNCQPMRADPLFHSDHFVKHRFLLKESSLMKELKQNSAVSSTVFDLVTFILKEATVDGHVISAFLNVLVTELPLSANQNKPMQWNSKFDLVSELAEQPKEYRDLTYVFPPRATVSSCVAKTAVPTTSSSSSSSSSLSTVRNSKRRKV